MDPEAWELSEFFKRLFNACFPVDFRDKQRECLESFTQGKHSVQKYVASLKELFAIVGIHSKCEKVIELFKGFCPSIQKDLYKQHLTPEIAKWGKVVEEAEYLELAEKVELGETCHVLSAPDNRHQGPGNGGGSSSSHGGHTIHQM